LWGDAHHWWDDRPFLTNLLSSFTGLLVGVPFALVVLSHLGAMQADAANRRAAIRRGREAARQFRSTVVRGFAKPLVEPAAQDLIRLRTANLQLKQRLPHDQQIVDVFSNADEIRRLFDVRKRAIDEAFRLASEAREGWLSEVAQAWDRLDREVRPRLEEVGAHWMRSDAYTELRKAGRQLDNLSAVPMRGLARQMRIFDQASWNRGPTPSLSEAMEAVAALRADTDTTHEAVVALLEIVRNISHVEQVGT
jgi:hypothetical protein